MKFLRKKKTRPEKKNITPVGPEPENQFYSHSAEEAPLDEYTDGQGRQIRRTSRHTPARRRENNNRASHKELSFLVLKVFLIPVLIFAGYLGLKYILGFLDGPSEKDIREWEASEQLMERGGDGESGKASAEEAVLNQSDLHQRIVQWEQAERHLRAAESLAQRGIGDEAADRLQQALRYAPENQAAQKLLLDVYMEEGNFEAAVPLCISLLDQNSLSWETKMKLLKALQEIDETAAIVVLVDRMLELQPENSDVLESAAYAHAAEGDTEQALDLYARILQNDKTHVLALEGSGFIYQWLQEWREAIPYYLELLKVSPEEDHYHALARCYAQLGKESKSVIFLGQAASLYGEGQVSPWLREADFDDVRETVDFRALTDRIVGIETRKAIENIRRREIAKPVPEEIEDFKLQMKPELDILKPRR